MKKKHHMWKRTLAAVLSAACLPLSTLALAADSPPAGQAEVSAVVEDGRATIGNSYISREFSIAGDKLSTTSITNKRTDGGDTVFTPGQGSEEFKIRLVKNDDDHTVTTLPALDKTGWTATADSYCSTSTAEGADGGPANLIDGNVNTHWHTNYDGNGTGPDSYPFNVVIDLGGSVTFQCFSYTPRQQGETVNGNVEGYELYYSDSATALSIESAEWQLLKEGRFQYDGTNPIYVNLDAPCTATQLKLKCVSAHNGRKFGGGAEFDLYADRAPDAEQKLAREFFASDLTLQGSPTVEDTSATINGVDKTGKKMTFSFAPFTFRNVAYTISEVVVMYDGDHFMRKYLEISVPDGQEDDAVIDYIDLESLAVNPGDATWTISTNAGGIVQMEQFKANLGQPIYIQGMFFGCEFPAADNQIVDGTGYLRYYTGKSFTRLGLDSQLTTDGKYVTWQTVAGAARSTENAVIQADFFEYINSIATPSEFRIQYNSWFDNMMRIDDDNILESFIEIDKELDAAGVRPLDSYVVDDGWNNYNHTGVVDAVRSGTTLNQTGFWEFNSKFPDGLTPSSELVHKFGSNFGLWVGPRGGYNFYSSLANILEENGTGSKAGGSIDVADRVYVQNFTDMAVEWMEQYGVNYWKWDGFADQGQYNTWAASDGVPGYANHHMTGGSHQMYHVTDLWEAWIDLMETVRQCEQDEGINKLWISLTCYVNPSPWFLQWANSVWIQCIHDQSDAGSSSSKMDRQLTYRDACYYDFVNNHQFQFPFSNVYNHDPIYGVEGTGMNIDTATDEQFKNYLYMQSTRGTSFWELYFSDSIMTQGKYEVTAEFLSWAEENYHMLKNAKMIGADPYSGVRLSSVGSGSADAYGYACFDGTDGLISVRNPDTAAKDITITFDRTIGVPEDAGILKYHLEHAYNLTAGTDTTGQMTYGQTYTLTLQPDEVRILRFSKTGDTTAPAFAWGRTDGANGVTVQFSEKVAAGTFTVNGEAAVAEASADGRTFYLTASAGALDNAQTVTVTASGVSDMAGNTLTQTSISFPYWKDNTVAAQESQKLSGTMTLAAQAASLTGSGGFTVNVEAATLSTGTLLAQGDSYSLSIRADGKASFTVNGAAAVSETAVNDGALHTITGVKENNGMVKLYVDGELERSAYKAENRDYEVQSAAVTLGSSGFYGIVGVRILDTAWGYDAVRAAFRGDDGSAGTPGTPFGLVNLALNKDVIARWTEGGGSASENPDRPMSKAVDGIKNDTVGNYAEFGADGNDASSYLQVDLGEVKCVSQINLYRYWSDGRTYKGTVIELSETADFATAIQIYNSDGDGSLHGRDFGGDSTYAETEDGMSFTLDSPVHARYVRVYMHGTTTGGTTNHVVELEVMGY